MATGKPGPRSNILEEQGLQQQKQGGGRLWADGACAYLMPAPRAMRERASTSPLPTACRPLFHGLVSPLSSACSAASASLTAVTHTRLGSRGILLPSPSATMQGSRQCTRGQHVGMSSSYATCMIGAHDGPTSRSDM